MLLHRHRVDAPCSLTKWQHFSAWSDIMAAILNVWRQSVCRCIFTWRTFVPNFIRFKMRKPLGFSWRGHPNKYKISISSWSKNRIQTKSVRWLEYCILFWGHTITPRMTVAHIVCRGVRKRTERFQRCCLMYRHLSQNPRYVLADVHGRLGAVLNKLVFLCTAFNNVSKTTDSSSKIVSYIVSASVHCVLQSLCNLMHYFRSLIKSMNQSDHIKHLYCDT